MKLLILTEENLEQEHICCAIADTKTTAGVTLKKEWLKNRFQEGLVFRKADVRGKVFIEYLPAENAWCPIDAEGYMFINCFWVAGRYQKQGYGTELLNSCLRDSTEKKGIVIVSSAKKRPYLSDKVYLLKNGFEVADTAPPYFELLVKRLQGDAAMPKFRDTVKSATFNYVRGLTVLYTDQCPFVDYYVQKELDIIGAEFSIPVHRIKLENKEQAQRSPAAFTSFSAFYNGEFLTHEVLTKVKFSKLWEKIKNA
ncbi:GNAT family N-acetyltransferase [Sporomusa malonica]|uniref:Acetyltransferase (GNAT) domain-containing protein n=1 Tax=Sporomusa malonica TaxID=112901 RepID=A0A1W2CXR3_9FIRM|nr:GNAT family N-acetyltransferase [Sporomusa malonica]SMC90013.1 Acetyltransferase (GNAT) domain-containing protein [Sporomusa malonica]